jgi:hypothetical protein
LNGIRNLKEWSQKARALDGALVPGVERCQCRGKTWRAEVLLLQISQVVPYAEYSLRRREQQEQVMERGVRTKRRRWGDQQSPKSYCSIAFICRP